MKDGKTFHVNSGGVCLCKGDSVIDKGDDRRTGTDRKFPLRTVGKAISKCEIGTVVVEPTGDSCPSK